ncbi:MAG: serine/threonine-protein kinase PknK, partial [Thiohalomonadales bacterium]
MGVVYKALDIRLERYLALKFLPHNLTTDARAKKRLIREAKAASAISHRHLCTVFDIEETPDGQIYIAMAYYSGKNLESFMADGPLALDQAIAAGQQIASGLVAAHEKSIIHRDIKPANLIFSHNQNIKILDFGIAKFADMQNTDTGIQGGTVAYMSPEHIRGEKVDHRTDIWSTAIILFEMITGKKPFYGDSLPETMHRVLNDPTPRLSKYVKKVPPLLDELINKALSKDIKERFQTMPQFLHDLKKIAKELDIHGPESVEFATPPSVKYKKTEDSLVAPAHTAHTNSSENQAPVNIAISLANYDTLNNSLDSGVFQQFVGLYLRGIKQRIYKHNGNIKTLIGDTIICEINDADALAETARLAVISANDIHKYVQDISTTFNIDLHCFMLISQKTDSEVDLLTCVNQLKSIASATDIFTSDMVYQAICSEYSGLAIDNKGKSTDENSSLDQDKTQLWKIRDKSLSPADETIINNNLVPFASAEPTQTKAGLTKTVADMPDNNPSFAASIVSKKDQPESDISANKRIPHSSIAHDTVSDPATMAAAEPETEFELESKITLESGLHDIDEKLSCDSWASLESIEPPELSKNEIDAPPVITSDAHLSDYACDYISAASFVGRERFLQDIEEIFANCLDKKTSHFIHISGTHGVGKTRMLMELKSMATQLGFDCHHQVNVEYGADEGLQLFGKMSKSILKESFGREINAELNLLELAISAGFVTEDLQVYLYDLLGLTPNKSLSAKNFSCDYKQWVSQRDQTLVGLIATAAAKKPLAILIDDLHWVDNTSLTSFIKLVTNSAKNPVLFITTSHRSSSRVVALVNQHLSLDQFTLLELAALNEQQANQLALLQEDLPPHVLPVLLREAKGMPLKITLLARYFQRSGRTPFPPSVDELVSLYLSTFADEDIKAVWAASVIGGVFSQSCLRYLMQNQDYDCQHLVDIGFASNYEKLFVFAQPLVYRAIYDSMEEETKNDLHLQAAEWYAYVDIAIQAEHLHRAKSNQAAEVYLQAASHLYDIFHLERARKYTKLGLQADAEIREDNIQHGNLIPNESEYIKEQLEQLLENINRLRNT